MPVLEDTRWCAVSDCARLIGDPRSLLCGACTTVLETKLRDVAALDLDAELDTTRHRQDRTRRPGAPTTGRGDPGLPFSERAVDAGGRLWGVLSGWATVMLDAERPPHGCVALPVGPWCRTCTAWADTYVGLTSLTSLADYLGRNVDRLAAHPDAGMAAQDIPAAVTACRKAIDLPPDLVYAGPCDTCGDGMYAHPKRDTCRCFYCDARYEVSERRAWMLDALHDRLFTATEIAFGLPTLLGERVSVERLLGWVKRGLIAPAEVDDDGKSRYRLQDVVDTITHTATSNRRKPSGPNVAES